MNENLEVGQVLEGKVTGIQSYGAFVEISEEIQGLVHISEITHGYVKDIHEHLTVGDNVTVKILNIDEEKGKYSLSIRATEEAPKKQSKKERPAQTFNQEKTDAGFNTLKDKLQDWISQSKEREQTFKK